MNLFKKLETSLIKTRQQWMSGLAQLFKSHTLDQQSLEQIETQLLRSDVSFSTVTVILDLLKKQFKESTAQKTELSQLLHTILIQQLTPFEKPLSISKQHLPFVILVVGVNGSGKTTSIAKLGYHLKQEGLKVLLSAGDTFRAAAVEQLQIWGARHQMPVIAQQSGADSAAVTFDALQSAKAKQMDVVIADTAGRLHTQKNLMQELEKIIRVIRKFDTFAPHEILLTLDATTGQNALIQAKQFQQVIPITGIILTKLDSTAKGGIIFSVVNELKIPIKFITMGEDITDLQRFNAKDFVEALFNYDSIEPNK
jgi:fused signal recognition particle receptor